MKSSAAVCLAVPIMAVLTASTEGSGESQASGAPAIEARKITEIFKNCVSCHPRQAKPQPETSMAHALETVADCGILRSHPLLKFARGRYSYRIERSGNQSIYTVAGGGETFSVAIAYALGLGSAGQTYVFEKEGTLYESMVSFYRSIEGLDVTLGNQNLHPMNVLEAAGRRLANREATLCFNCHATNAVSGSKLSLEAITPGVQCERCHGDTQQHLAGLQRGDVKQFAMENLRSMSADETAHFCGQCHHTWEQVASNGPQGTANVRFQPYRLTNSHCYDPDDKRISCVACHDPHKEVDPVTANYDSKCVACHGGGKIGAKACTVGKADCASCHMPKVELNGGHHKFTDHQIRIMRPGSPYPD